MRHREAIAREARIKARLVVACDQRNNLSISLEIPPNDLCVRKWLISDLRRKGYRLREIGALLGLTRQRVYQIERRLVRRSASKHPKAKKYLRTISRAPAADSMRRILSAVEYNKRLDELNQRYERQLQRILHVSYKRPRSHTAKSAPTLFWKVWPCIERYGFRPFSFSHLISDHPALAREPLLAQLLSHLRKQRMLKKVGLERAPGHNLPEIIMVQASLEEYVAPIVEKLAARWSVKLSEFQRTYSETRPTLSIDALRESLIHNLNNRGMRALEIEDTFARTA